MHPGDVVAASEDGIVVVPQMSLPAVVDTVSKVATRVIEWRGESDQIAPFLDEMDEHVAAVFIAGRGKLLRREPICRWMAQYQRLISCRKTVTSWHDGVVEPSVRRVT